MERIYEGAGHPDFVIQGKLTTDIDSRDSIVLIRRPTFVNFRQLESAAAIICMDQLSQTSHEVLLLKDMYIPLIHGVGPEIKSELGTLVTLISQNGRGVISTDARKPQLSSPIAKRKYAITSTLRGLQHHKALQAEVICMRGEFIYLQSIDTHPLKIINSNAAAMHIKQALQIIIRYGLENFEHVIYRFSDLSIQNLGHLKDADSYEEDESNPVLGNRGTYRLLNKHRALFELELAAIRDLSKIGHLSVLLPYVRTISEAQQAIELIKGRLGAIKIGCMVEVPAMVLQGAEVCPLFDFFVIGTKDLTQLLSGTDRDTVFLKQDLSSIIAKMLHDYFLPHTTTDQTIYITSKQVQQILAELFGGQIVCLYD